MQQLRSGGYNQQIVDSVEQLSQQRVQRDFPPYYQMDDIASAHPTPGRSTPYHHDVSIPGTSYQHEVPGPSTIDSADVYVPQPLHQSIHSPYTPQADSPYTVFSESPYTPLHAYTSQEQPWQYRGSPVSFQQDSISMEAQQPHTLHHPQGDPIPRRGHRARRPTHCGTGGHLRDEDEDDV